MKNNNIKEASDAVFTAASATAAVAQYPEAETASTANRAPGAPCGLLTNESEYPMNIEGAPLFDWWVNDDDFDEVQTAYQIRLYDGVSYELVWDSGKVESGEQNCVPYAGGALKPGYPYNWEVRTWDSHGEVSPYSERAQFATGLGNDYWDAQWILGVAQADDENESDADNIQNCSAVSSSDNRRALTADNTYWYSRKEVSLEPGKQIKKAIAYVSGSQDYELSVNGIRIGRAQTYDYPGETKYQGWDITDAVKGKDKLAIGILNSYFAGGQGRSEQSMAGLLGRFIVYYTDGSSQSIVTDGTWLTHSTGYYNIGARNSEGDEIEYCDARLMLSGWSELGYDTAGWVPVIVYGTHPTENFSNLQPELGKVTETLVSAVSVTKLADGTTVADFGKVIPAMLTIHFPDGKTGTQITIQEGYELTEDGSINTSIQSTQHTNMTYVYIMKDGEQTFEAWGYLGFRYVSVPAEAGDLSVDDFKATVVHAETVTGRRSTLCTSNDMLNRVFELMQRSALYSVQNQFVDTPTREKGQFLVDAVNSSAATTSGSYERQMTRKAILQFLDSSDRFWSDEKGLGMYNAVYPNIEGCRGIPDFSLNLPLMVWRYYMLTADLVLLKTAYPYMKNTADFVTRSINPETGLVTAIYGGGEHRSYSQGIVDSPSGRFGYDWKGTVNGARTTINALGVRVYDLVVKMAEVLGNLADASFYREKKAALSSAMNKLLITEDGLYCDGLTAEGKQSPNMSQHATSHAIMAGIYSERALSGLADYIAGLGMKQGPMTVDILMEALFKAGRGDAAVRILTNTEDYSFGKLIRDGYTYTWENWQAGSQSHGWGSASLWQIIEYISGVKITEAGAKTIRIAPLHGAVDEVSSHTVTARGAVDISYSGSGKSYVITIEVPANVTAEVVFPLIDGGRFVEVSGKNGINEFTEDSQIMTVGSGKRSFAYVEGSSGSGNAGSFVPDITSASVTFGTNLAMNYAVTLPDDYSIDNAHMVFTMNGVSVTVRDYASSSAGYVFTFTDIAPQCMGDSIKAELYMNDVLVDIYDNYSVKAYAEQLLELHSGNELVTDLVIDMLNYGAAAQVYKSYKVDKLVNADLGGVGSDATPTVADRASSVTASANSNYGFTAAGVRFDYVNKVYVKFTVADAAPDTDSFTVTVDGGEVAVISLGNGEYIAYSDDVSALSFDKVFSFELKVNGETVQTLTYSINSYAYAKHDDGTAMGDLALALYRYGQSAVAYDLNN